MSASLRSTFFSCRRVCVWLCILLLCMPINVYEGFVLRRNPHFISISHATRSIKRAQRGHQSLSMVHKNNLIIGTPRRIGGLQSLDMCHSEDNNHHERPTIGTHRLSLQQGQWIKIINGAANQDLPLIRNLCYLYTLVGVDCFDLSPDLSVLLAAHSGIHAAMKEREKMMMAMTAMTGDEKKRTRIERPLVMISITDGEDLHFRKASFDPRLCPIDCPRPCERVCPASAIPPLSTDMDKMKSMAKREQLEEGVITSKCYGCGRCIDICPRGLILAKQFTFSLDEVESLLSATNGERLVDAIEIHTSSASPSLSSANDGLKSFTKLWNRLGETILRNVQVLSISLQDGPIKSNRKVNSSTMNSDHVDTISFIKELYQLITSHSQWNHYQGSLLWQTDGRPMSGDIGKGSTHATIQFAAKLLQEAENIFTISKPIALQRAEKEGEQNGTVNGNQENVFVQLAGGANQYTVPLAKEEVITDRNRAYFGGVAFGGYARKTITQLTRHLSNNNASFHIEDYPNELSQCLEFVDNLIKTVKS